ncbi:PREDICTED: uncharacterized protein LOC107071035 [Polistes dominula]|uniref:Gustatory receptor n=1 Tax=Polistes dominula TaxID=743375 RepID=A0ABM1IY89_POLDO|nr:PREDICTED: uncharacterized protein LOC107071035 [Polistes dominula]
MVVGLFKNQQWDNSIRSLEEIDKTLKALGSNSRFHKIYVRTMIEIIFFLTYLILMTSFDVYFTNVVLDENETSRLLTLFFAASHIYGEVIAITVILEFLTVVRCIKSELERSNDLLSDINILPRSSIALELIKYYHRLVLNQLSSIPHFVISTIFKVIFINYTCDETTQKMEKVNEIIYTFYAESTDHMIQQEVKMFTLQTAHCQSTITLIVTIVIDFSFVFWVRYIGIKFNELNGILENMLTTTIDLPQHKKVVRMKDNWEDDLSLSIIYHMYKANENYIKLNKIRDFMFQLLENRLTFTICGFFELNHTFLYSIRDFIIQLIQNPLSLTTCGFFSLDHTLISNVISTVTTYLVILIQVGNVPAQFYPNSTILTTDL